MSSIFAAAEGHCCCSGAFVFHTWLAVGTVKLDIIVAAAVGHCCCSGVGVFNTRLVGGIAKLNSAAAAVGHC